MARGDHIYVKRVTYSHHGIEVDDNYVVHFSGEPSSKNGARIKITSMKEFHCGDRIQKVLYSANIPYSKNEIVNRAYARLGETSYDVVFNNCEHFARWCATNEHKSEQVKNICSSASGTAGTTAITSTAIGSVAIAGAVPGLSGAGIMSGLAAIGPGGVIGGIATLSTAPAIISNIAMNNILEDDKSLSDEERESRLVGRVATKLGTVAGAAGTVSAISAAGATIGLSAAGITSGIATIGGTVGGGMAAGAAMTIAAPAVAAAGVGYSVYKVWKWLSE